MKLITRGLLLIFIVGVVLLLVAFQTPSVSLVQNVSAGSQASQIYFFQPMTISVSISQLLGNATLLIQPVNYYSNLGSPLANASVVAQDIVTISIPNRGYYDVSFVYGNGTSPAISYAISESGTPSDLLIAGATLMVSALAVFGLFALARTRRFKIGTN